MALALAIPGYVTVAHPQRIPALNHMTDGAAEIFPFFNWSLFSAPRSFGVRHSVRVLGAETASDAEAHLGEVLNLGDADFIRNIRFTKTLRSLADPNLVSAPGRLDAALAQVSNFIRPMGVTEFEVVVEVFNPMDATAPPNLHTVSKQYAVIGPAPQS